MNPLSIGLCTLLLPLSAWALEWIEPHANDSLRLEKTESGWRCEVKGTDPFLTFRLDAPLVGPVELGLEVQSAEELLYLELRSGEEKWSEPLRRLLLGGSKGQTVWFHFEQGQQQRFRLDLSGQHSVLIVKALHVRSISTAHETGHPVLPKPTWKNSAYVVPIHETFDDARYDDASRRKDMQQLKQEIGPGRLYVRTGFSASSPQSWKKQPALPTVRLLAQEGLVWHVHHHLSNHSIGRHAAMLDAVKRDRRNSAWSVDGNCRGVAKGWDDAHVFTEEGLARQSVLACVSPLNLDVVRARREIAQWLNVTQSHAQALREFPETMISAGASVENELPQSPHAWGCYSPYSVQDFQDWLRHRAPASVTGEWLHIDGKLRSPFHDDPSPQDANGTGPSFNAWFGTAFETWTLEYWDLAAHPPGSLPWATDLANALPKEGEIGNTKGQAFDAPRVVDPKSRFWQAWDNEDARAPGYRQHAMQAWNSTVVEDLVATGFARERLFTHQIPAEFLGERVMPSADYRVGQSVPLLRRFSTATPLWTADDGLGAHGGHGLGITAFDYMTDESVMAKARGHDANWALLEYHPDSPAQPSYARCMDSLRGLHRQRVHVLAPGWWGYKKPPFMLNGTPFAQALKDWIDNPSGLDRSDQPWNETRAFDYTPPPVHGLSFDAKTHTLRWSDRLWPDVEDAPWSLWREWAEGAFVVRRHLAGEVAVAAEVSGTTFEWVDPQPTAGATYTIIAKRRHGITLESTPSVAVGP